MKKFFTILFFGATIILSCSQENSTPNNGTNGGATNGGTTGGGTSGGCPTTANCGCSGKTKAQCELDPCCRWVVGEGCKCK